MSELVVAYWKSFGLIVGLCAVVAYARNRLMRTQLSGTDVAMHAAFSAFVAMLLLMLANAAGLDWGYWDEAVLAIGYVMLGPPRFIRDQQKS